MRSLTFFNLRKKSEVAQIMTQHIMGPILSLYAYFDLLKSQKKCKVAQIMTEPTLTWQEERKPDLKKKRMVDELKPDYIEKGKKSGEPLANV